MSNKYAEWLMARAARLATIQSLYNDEELALEDALEILNGNLSPDDDSTKCDDREYLEIKKVQ